ncbi:hypothetical protein FBU30_001181 [Linnemannia zychae]|nr:hypothetical protein FBU30_001181 [Linnemannia zychae]
MCGANGHDPHVNNNDNDDAPVLSLPTHLYSQLTDAHCHIQDDRKNIRALVESWSASTTSTNNESASASVAPLLTGKLCLMGVQPSKDLGLDKKDESNINLETIEVNTASLSLNTTSHPTSTTPIVTVSWSETDVQGDWDLVAKLAETYPDRFVPCFGIHPWFTHKYKPLEGGFKGNTFELRSVSNTGNTSSNTGGVAADSPSLSFSSTFLTPVPGPGVRREAFLAMSKQLQEQMAKESREREASQADAGQEDKTNPNAANLKQDLTLQDKGEKDSQSIDVTLPNTDDARFSHYKAVLSLPASASESYLADLAKRLPEPRALEPALKELRRQLEAHPHAVLGEIGLDRTARVPEPSFIPSQEGAEESSAPQKRITLALTSIQHQLDVVREQLKLAAELNRPVSLHCVQAYGHWHDFLIQEGRRLRQLEAEKEYQIQLQQIQAAGGTMPPQSITSPTGVRLSKRSTARLKREARDAAWERHVESTLQDSSDEDESSSDDEDDNSGNHKANTRTSTSNTKEDPTTPNAASNATTLNETPAVTMSIPQPSYEPVLPPRLCMHSYGGSVDMIKAFTKLDHPPEIYFSFSILINGRLQERKLKELILAVPEDRLLIESDHHSHTMADQLLVEMVHKIAEIRGWTVEETIEKTARNWHRFVYGNDISS